MELDAIGVGAAEGQTAGLSFRIDAQNWGQRYAERCGIHAMRDTKRKKKKKK